MNPATPPPDWVAAELEVPSSSWRDLIASLRRHVGERLPETFLVIGLSTILEGAGLVMILPVAEIIFSQASEGSPISNWLLGLLRSVGATTIPIQLGLIAALFCLLLMVRSLILMRRDVLMVSLSQGYVDGIRRQIFEVLARADWPVIKTYERAHLLDNMTANVGRIAQAVNVLTQGLVTIALSLVLVASAFIIDAALGAMLAAMAAGVGILAVMRLKESRQLGNRMTRENHGVMQETTRFLDGLKAAKACQAEEEFSQRFKAVTDRTRQTAKRFVVQQSRLRRGVELAGAIATICLLLVGYGWLGLSGAELLIMGAIVVRLVPGLIAIFNGMQSVAFALPAFRSAEHLKRMIEKQATDAQGLVPPAISASECREFGGLNVEAASVWIGAEHNAQRLVEALNLKIEATGLTHVFGPSGAGKSTLVELLSGLYLPTDGHVSMVLGQETLALDASTRSIWQSAISYAPQEPFLFSGTVRENLCWPNNVVSDDDIWEALRVACADDLVRDLPNGLDEALMDDGQRLSGGERQRLSLARTLLRPACLLILDETTSSVDRELENKIFTNLAALAKRKAVLLVCHSVEPLGIARTHIEVSDGCARMVGE